MKWSLKARAAIVGGVAAIGAAGALLYFRGGLGRTASEPIDTVPRDSFLVATLDLAELRRSPISEAIFGKDSAPKETGTAKALGMGGLARACGFDPLSRVQKLAVALPEEGDRGDFGVAARVEVTREELAKCTEALESKRDGKVQTRDVGHFVVIEDPGQRRIAYGPGGLLVIGKGSWFDAMLGAAEHEKPSIKDAAEHAAIRSTLTSQEGWRAPTMLVTALLPRSLRDRLKNEMGAGVDAQDPSSTIMAGVLGVSGVGFALRAGIAGENVDARIELVCDSPEACVSVQKLIQKKRLDWSKDLGLRMIGFGAVIDSLEVQVEGTHLHASASANANALAATLERAMKLRGRPTDLFGAAGHDGREARDQPGPPPAAPGGPGGTGADEHIGARDAGIPEPALKNAAKPAPSGAATAKPTGGANAPQNPDPNAKQDR